MWTEGTGERIGSQQVWEGSTFDPKTPQEFGFPGEVHHPELVGNIKFDTVNGWEILPETRDKLDESAPYRYGRNLSVKASWWKKIQTLIHTFDVCPNIQTDLDGRVHVRVGHPDGNIDRYSFFGQTDPVSFLVDGNIANTKTITVNDRTYTFIAWVKGDLSNMTTPHMYERLEIDDRNLAWNLQDALWFKNRGRFVNCLAQETALFISGTGITIIVRTNASGTFDATHHWNNNPKRKFQINWVGPVGGHDTDGPEPFSTGQTDSHPITVDDENLGYGFYVSLSFVDDDGPHWIEPGYDIRGWYFGNFDGHEDDFNVSQLQYPDRFYSYDDSVNCHGAYESPVFMAAQSYIYITLIYSKTNNAQYTITYYSGIDNN